MHLLPRRLALSGALWGWLLRGIVGWALCTSAWAVETIRVVTEELPPYNMTQGGHITGMSTEIVEAVMKQVGVRGAIESMPWERCYETALTAGNVLIYSIKRTPERESQFKWVGAVGPSEKIYLYASPRRPMKFASLTEARAYSIATINGDWSEQYLLSNGFSGTNNLTRTGTLSMGYQQLQAGRVDLWLADALVAKFVARNAGGDAASTLLPAYEILNPHGEALMIAFGPHTPDALVQRFRDGLDAIHANGTFDAIQKKWH